MKIIDKEFNSINLLLSLIILIAAMYTGIEASIATPSVQPKNVVSEVQLTTHIFSGNSLYSLDHDIKLISQANAQTTTDQNLVKKGLNDANYIIKPSVHDYNPGLEIARRITLLALLRRQILATDILTKQQKKKFSNNITSLASIIDAKGGISTNVITNSYPQFQLLLQQVEMIKLADDQQVSENLLSQISSRLSSAVAEAGKQGLAITNPQADLTTLNSDVLYGHALSSAIESSLQLNNVNSYDFRTYYAQSVTASRDINAAVNAAREVIGILQSS